MSEHTPGPWSVYPCDQGGGILRRGDRQHPQSHLQIVPMEDARLIAAAPELLALIQRVPAECIMSPAIEEDIRAVLRAATGGE